MTPSTSGITVVRQPRERTSGFVDMATEDQDQETTIVADGGGENDDERRISKFPTGFRFKPTDEELVEFYLLPRLQGRPTVPNDAIIEANVYEFHPEILVYEKYRGRGEDAWYFVSPRARIYQKGARPARKTEDGRGRWKSSTANKVVSDVTVGDGIKFSKNVLNYFVGTPKKEVRTKWLMREFTIPEYKVKRGSNSGGSGTLDEYVMCKIYLSPVHKESDDEPSTSTACEEAEESSRTRKRARQGSLAIGQGQAQASGAGNVSVPAQRTTYNGQLAPVQRPPIPMQFSPNAATTFPNFSGQMTTMVQPPNLGFPAPGTGFRPQVSLNCYYDHNYMALQLLGNAAYGMLPQQRQMAFPPPPPPQQQDMYFNGNGNDHAGAAASQWSPFNEGSSMTQATGDQSEATSTYAGSGLRSRGGNMDAQYQFVDLASINTSLAGSPS
ncbi:hypothetical protein QOZ80_6AG0537410 [Eleusine coracana subsp. coracana]|nr:hypothetical protein QOZ80_6AG0537410 [Eleusine coracana subsp. coracana]